MPTAIVYKTRLGSTEKYAKWLQEEIEADLFQFDDCKGDQLNKYDTVIVMSGTYATIMPLGKYLKKNWSCLKGKKVFVIAVGAAPPESKNSKMGYNRIPREIRDQIVYKKIIGFMGPEPENPVKKENLHSIIQKIKQKQK